MDYWTHRDALDNKEVPASLTIVGGGVIGMEFASFFTSLGVQVTVVEMLDEILGGMDKELSAMLRAEYAKKESSSCSVRSSRGIQRGDRYYCVIRKCRWNRNCYS